MENWELTEREVVEFVSFPIFVGSNGKEITPKYINCLFLKSFQIK